VAQQPRALNPAGSPEQLYGAQLRARRVALDLSQDALGRRANFTGAVIGKWEKGQSLPDQATAVLLDQLLGDDGVLLAAWRYAASHRAARDRELQPWQLMDAITRTHISPDALDMMGRAVLAAAARYPSTPPDLLLPVVNEQIQRLRDAIEATGSARSLRRIVQLTGVCAGIAGNLYIDLGNPARAADYFQVGRRAGHEAEDPALTAWVLTTESIGPLHTRRPHEAAELVDQALALVAGTGNLRRESWVAAMAAHAHAALGAHNAALDTLTHSAAALETADEATGMDFFDAARLEGIAGTVHLRLGHTAESAEHLTAAIAQRDTADAKGRALLTFDLAECAIRSGDPEHAAGLAHQALDTAAGQYVRPVVDRAQALHTQLAAFPQLPHAAEYRDRLRELAPVRPSKKERSG
jgi:transcriptional regulator with XRE-family HTH domain